MSTQIQTLNNLLLPVKSEHRAVDVNVRDFDEGLQPQKYVQHDEIPVPENNSA